MSLQLLLVYYEQSAVAQTDIREQNELNYSERKKYFSLQNKDRDDATLISEGSWRFENWKFVTNTYNLEEGK